MPLSPAIATGTAPAAPTEFPCIDGARALAAFAQRHRFRFSVYSQWPGADPRAVADARVVGHADLTPDLHGIPAGRGARRAAQSHRRVHDGDLRYLQSRGSSRVRRFLNGTLHADDALIRLSNVTSRA